MGCHISSEKYSIRNTEHTAPQQFPNSHFATAAHRHGDKADPPLYFHTGSHPRLIDHRADRIDRLTNGLLYVYTDYYRAAGGNIQRKSTGGYPVMSLLIGSVCYVSEVAFDVQVDLVGQFNVFSC